MATDHIQGRARRRQAANRRRPFSSKLTGEGLAGALKAIAHELDNVHAACVTVGVALTSQSADYDAEIGRCLRANVGTPLSRQIAELRSLAQAVSPTKEVALIPSE